MPLKRQAQKWKSAQASLRIIRLHNSCQPMHSCLVYAYRAGISCVIANCDAACDRRGWKKRAMRWLRSRWRTIPRQEYKTKHFVKSLIFASQTLPDLKADVKRSLQQQECEELRCMRYYFIKTRYFTVIDCV